VEKEKGLSGRCTHGGGRVSFDVFYRIEKKTSSGPRNKGRTRNKKKKKKKKKKKTATKEEKKHKQNKKKK